METSRDVVTVKEGGRKEADDDEGAVSSIAAGIFFRVFFSNTYTRYIPAYTDPEIPIPGITAAIDPTYPPRSPKYPSPPGVSRPHKYS